MGYGPVKTDPDEQDLVVANKAEILSTEIYATGYINERLADLINKITGDKKPEVQEAMPASMTLLDIMNSGPGILADCRRKAIEQIATIEDLLF